MRKHQVFLALSLIVTTLLLIFPVKTITSQTQAVTITSSPNPLGSGARALNLGSSFIAVVDDAT